MSMKKKIKQVLAFTMAVLMIAGSFVFPAPVMADGTLVLTLGADLSEEEKQGILEFFNVKETDAMLITVTNADERELLLGQYTEAQIGTRTFSCALVNPTASGGIQVKTANMNVVTSGRIASLLSTSGITDCEVLAAAPFMVSGTGALTGVMMGYEKAVGISLDPEKQQMAIEESTTVSEIGDTMGQNEATLVVNDIKIRIVRDNATADEEIANAVNVTVDQIEEQLAELADVRGNQAPEKLDQSGREVLYDYGRKISNMNYDYDQMKLTLQRVTTNAAREIGIDDPITETFEDLSAEDVLPENSILRGTNDEAMGEDANITATDTVALDGNQETPTLDAAVAAESLNGHLYALFDLSMSWKEAERYCWKLDGELASINTLEEQQFVEALAAKSSKNYSWLGGEYYPENDRWYWSRGRFNFTNWDDGQPDGASSGELWLCMANHDINYDGKMCHAGKWNDAKDIGNEDIPLEELGFICEIEQDREQSIIEDQDTANAVARDAKITDVKLTRVGSVEGADNIVNGTQCLIIRSGDEEYLADLSGNLLTDTGYYQLEMQEKGLIPAISNTGAKGVLDQNGAVVVPCSYDVTEILSPHWIIGIHLTDGTEDDYDYKNYLDEAYYQISSADVYYTAGGEGTMLKTLSRQEYQDAEAQDDYVNIEDRSGAVATYDSSFNMVADGVSYVDEFSHIVPEPYSYYYDSDAEHRYGVQDAGGSIVLSPFADSISRIRDGYIEFSMEDSSSSYLDGIAALDGTIILPADFERISNYANGPVDEEGSDLFYFNCRGYYSVVQDGTLKFAVEGGSISCDTGISKDDDYYFDEGCTIRKKEETEHYTLYAADGQVTKLDDYLYCYVLNFSSGLLYKANNPNTNTYDLLDWHGNVLLSDFSSVYMTGDGYYIGVMEGYNDPMDIYAVTYVYDNGQELSPEPLEGADESIPEEKADEENAEPEDTPDTEDAKPEDTPDTEDAEPERSPSVDEPEDELQQAPTEEPEEEAEANEESASAGEAEAQDNADLIKILENTVDTLNNTDFDSSREKVAQILESEANLLEGINADAASLLNSTVVLVQNGLSSAEETIAVIQRVIEML